MPNGGYSNGMEKKLTDEEIVKALEVCYSSSCCSANCPYFNKHGRNFCVEDKALYKDMKRIVEEHAGQKAEIEHLNAKYRNLEINYNDVYEEYRKLELENPKLKAEIETLKSPKFANWKLKFFKAQEEIESLKKDYIELDLECRELRTESDRMVAEHLAFVELAKKADEQQKAEIERLTEVVEGQRKIIEYQDSVEDRNAELQKQVDELTRNNQAMAKVIDSYKNGDFSAKMVVNGLNNFYEPIVEETKQQAVKDTAKEILSQLKDDFSDLVGMEVEYPLNKVKELANRYGVEVE